MNNTKIEKEFDKRFSTEGDLGKELSFFCTHNLSKFESMQTSQGIMRQEILSFIFTTITKAVEEERERVVDEITRFAIINRYEGERYFEIPESVILSLKSKSLKDK